jgi:hypothetical protein
MTVKWACRGGKLLLPLFLILENLAGVFGNFLRPFPPASHFRKTGGYAMTNKKRMAIATLCLSMGMGMAAMGTPTLQAQQTDENGQATNPQPHTKKELKNEKKHEKQELKHNQKADKAAKKADEHQGQAAYQQEKSANEASKANQEAQKPN